MIDRYPPVEPYESGRLDVGDGNILYWETVGNPAGTPAVYLHGGPGAGSSAGARRNFDPMAYRAVLFDQRGCGRSRPLAEDPQVNLATNTTAHLVADIEALREHLGIDRWVVFGVSWGVTLGLVYAQAHPERVIAMVLGAVTSGSRRETEWITRDMGRIFPREWEAFAARVPAAERDGDLAAGYARLLADPDPAVREEAARAWCEWEDIHVSLMPGWAPNPRYEDPSFRSVFARLVTHYWSHGCFLVDNQVLAAMPRLAEIPAVLIHGRYDISGPSDIAWQLHRAWPASKLELLDDAGHGGGSFPNRITAALNSFQTLA
ncbi:MAG TPA: prolyl aminopeptidase [Jatrophihabitans sp.]|jgi:proline iminopeptidase